MTELKEEKTEQPEKLLSGRVGKAQAGAQVKSEKSPEEKIKRKYKKKKKEEVPVTVPEDKARLGAKTIVNVGIRPPCKMLCAYDKHAQLVFENKDYTFDLTKDEAELWEASITEVLMTSDYAKYSKWFPWLSLITVAGLTFGSRFMALRTIRKAFKGKEDVNSKTAQPDNDNGNKRTGKKLVK